MPDPVANTLAINNRAANIVTLTTALGARPEHGFFRNLKNGRRQEFLFNPREFTEVYEALYARKSAPGLSHERLQFLGNRNGKTNLELVFDEYFLRRGFIGSNSVGGRSRRVAQDTAGTNRVSANSAVDAIKRFFLEAIYPRRSSKLISAAPPPLLFVWPGEISMKVRITRVSFRHAEFQVKSALTRVMIVNVNLEEEVEERIYSEDVFGYGTQRPWATSSASGSRRRRG